MISIKLLEEDDTIQKGQWCRPLVFMPACGGGDEYQATATYSGGPINNFKWVPVERVIGDCWFGKRLGDLNDKLDHPFEVAVGDIPESHILVEK